MKQSDGGTSVLDAIGAISYIPGIGSDGKTDSGINAGKLATVIIMHVIGIIIVCCFLYGKFVKKSINCNLYDYVSCGCNLLCPPVVIAMNVGRYLYDTVTG